MRRRFTLVELMIVVAIIMVLASIAMPNFYEMQLRAKRAEAPTNLDGMQTAIAAYMAAFDEQPGITAMLPDGSPGKTARDWTTGNPFDTIGFAPDGQVRGTYRFNTLSCPGNSVQGFGLNCGPTNRCGTVIIDVDGDNDNACLHFYVGNEVNEVETDYWGPNIY